MERSQPLPTENYVLGSPIRLMFSHVVCFGRSWQVPASQNSYVEMWTRPQGHFKLHPLRKDASQFIHMTGAEGAGGIYPSYF